MNYGQMNGLRLFVSALLARLLALRVNYLTRTNYSERSEDKSIIVKQRMELHSRVCSEPLTASLQCGSVLLAISVGIQSEAMMVVDDVMQWNSNFL